MDKSRRQFKRTLRGTQQQLESLGQQSEKGLDRYVFKRFSRLLAVRRFVIGWLLLVILLIGAVIAQNVGLSSYYQTVQAVPGGIYNEGVLGSFTNANPLYATTDVDSTVSQLLFAGLFNYDDQGHLSGDLAQTYQANARGDVYTVHLKPNLHWHDGQPLTSNDVLFTYQAIQNPDAQSPLESSWRGITVTAPDPSTVVFKLPDPLASFPYTMTNGIIPAHVLKSVPAADLRSADFNTVMPVGSGPFKWRAIQVSADANQAQAQIALAPFDNYQAGKPKLQEFIVDAYSSPESLAQAFQKQQVTGAAGLDTVPNNRLANSVQVHDLLLRAATMTFFNTSQGVLADKQVRQALVQAADVPTIVSRLGYATKPVREPLLSGQLGYDPALAQAGFNLPVAKKLLDDDGWKVGNNGVRIKNKQPLTFTLTAADTPEFRQVTDSLQRQWQALGVQLRSQLQSPADFQASLSEHSYEAVLYGISIGVDPDVFVYWDGSQADVRASNRLNLSEYKNPIVDSALEAGRTRLDPSLRVVKYKPFLQAWQQDAPALGLYQPRSLYLTNGSVAGLTDGTINKPTDRFANVQNWQIRQAKVTN